MAPRRDPQRFLDHLFRRMLLYLCRGVVVLEILLVLGRLGFTDGSAASLALLLNPLVTLAIVLGAMRMLGRARPSQALVDGVGVAMMVLISVNIGLVSIWVKNPIRLFVFAPLLVVAGVFLRSWKLHILLTLGSLGCLAFAWSQSPFPRESVGLALSTFAIALMLGTLLHVLVNAMVARIQRLLARLMNAQAQVLRLETLIPICAHCKKVRNDAGYWQQVETYVSERTRSSFTHGICPDCITAHWPRPEPSAAAAHPERP